jgi:hypothetical protein
MKLCIHCRSYGGVKASNGSYICNDPRNRFTHPVDGLEHGYDASWLRMAPELQGYCGLDGNWWKEREGGESIRTPSA